MYSPEACGCHPSGLQFFLFRNSQCGQSLSNVTLPDLGHHGTHFELSGKNVRLRNVKWAANTDISIRFCSFEVLLHFFLLHVEPGVMNTVMIQMWVPSPPGHILSEQCWTPYLISLSLESSCFCFSGGDGLRQAFTL